MLDVSRTSLWALSVMDMWKGRTGPQYCRTQQLDAGKQTREEPHYGLYYAQCTAAVT